MWKIQDWEGVWKIQGEFSTSVMFQALLSGARDSTHLEAHLSSWLSPLAAPEAPRLVTGNLRMTLSVSFEYRLENLHRPIACPCHVCPGNLCQSVML